MEEKTTKRLNLVLNEIAVTDDPTLVKCSFSILDFDESGNKDILEKDVAMGTFAKSILNKAIVGRYQINDGAGTDYFESHNPIETKDRYGNDVIRMDTTPIGTFTSEGYIKEVESEEGTKEVMVADAVLWYGRFPDAIDLLMDWHQNNVNVNMSCEYYFMNYEVKDGVQYIKEPVYFDGHCVLNSAEVDDYGVVNPSYKSATLLGFNEKQKFNQLIAKAMNNKKEDERMPEMFKKVFELSHSDIRTKLYKVLDAQLQENQYSWIRDVYDDYFIVEIETSTNDNYTFEDVKFNYSKAEDDTISIDFESKTPVMKKTEWVELEEVKTLQAQLSEKDETIKSLNNEKEALTTDKSEIEAKFNSATDTITSLSEKVEALKDYEEKYNAEQFEKQLNEKQEHYSAKFNALNASEKYESEEVQELVKQAVSDEAAITKLNSMLVDLVVAKNEEVEDKKTFTQLNSKREDLIPSNDDFDSRYGI